MSDNLRCGQYMARCGMQTKQRLQRATRKHEGLCYDVEPSKSDVNLMAIWPSQSEATRDTIKVGDLFVHMDNSDLDERM